ncbi:MAG: YeeE/YedE family protein [Boseongicola sp.]
MQSDWIWGLSGGVMIGMAAAIYLLVNGRVMGASGIVGGLIDGTARAVAGERLAFLTGLIAVPGLLAILNGGASTYITQNAGLVIAAGLLVGVGTRLANGCTSGHGVCGISRLSVRGIVATFLYILAGAVIIVALRQFVGV